MRTKLFLLFIFLSLENRVDAQKWKAKKTWQNKWTKNEKKLKTRKSTDIWEDLFIKYRIRIRNLQKEHLMREFFSRQLHVLV